MTKPSDSLRVTTHNEHEHLTRLISRTFFMRSNMASMNVLFRISTVVREDCNGDNDVRL